MNVQGFALQRASTGEQVAGFRWQTIPDRIDLPEGGAWFNAQVEHQTGDFEIVATAWDVPDPPPPPPPAPRQIAKSLVLDRLTDDQLSKALAAMSPRQQEQWRMPGYPTVSVEDVNLLNVLQAVGADPAKVLAE